MHTGASAAFTDFTIRRERPDQPEVRALLDALDAYLHSLYEPEANHILDVQALLAPSISFFVGRQGGRAVSTGAVRALPALRAGEIKRMYTEPSLRGRGCAARMIAVLEDEVRALGLEQAVLETGRDQHEAVRLYRRCGYTECPPFAGYPDNGLSLFMAKPLA
jgi:putative acetyltransferase